MGIGGEIFKNLHLGGPYYSVPQSIWQQFSWLETSRGPFPTLVVVRQINLKFCFILSSRGALSSSGWNLAEALFTVFLLCIQKLSTILVI